MEMGEMGTIRLHRVTQKIQIISLKNCLSTFIFFRFYCAFQEKIESS